MITPDKRLYQSLARLQDSFPDIIKWISDSLEEQKDLNIDLAGEDGIRGQGKAEVLREMLKKVTDAPEILKNRDPGESQAALQERRQAFI